jgi:hypothetical protein
MPLEHCGPSVSRGNPPVCAPPHRFLTVRGHSASGPVSVYEAALAMLERVQQGEPSSPTSDDAELTITDHHREEADARAAHVPSRLPSSGRPPLPTTAAQPGVKFAVKSHRPARESKRRPSVVREPSLCSPTRRHGEACVRSPTDRPYLSDRMSPLPATQMLMGGVEVEASIVKGLTTASSMGASSTGSQRSLKVPGKHRRSSPFRLTPPPPSSPPLPPPPALDDVHASC